MCGGRLHGGYGEPEEDMPALDPNRPAMSFGDDEFCLCELESSSSSSPSFSNGGGGQNRLGRSASEVPQGVITISMPNYSGQSKVKVTPEMTPRDLLFVMGKKYRLRYD